jgi:hypothetical protein
MGNGKSAFGALRDELATKQDWLRLKSALGFGIYDFDLDALIQEKLQPFSEDDIKYCPFLYDTLLSEISRSLDDCLAYRRELFDLSTKALSRALDYELFISSTDLDRDLAILNTYADQAKDESDFYQRSSERFEANEDKIRDDNLIAGLNEISKGHSNVKKLESERELRKVEIIKQKVAANEAYQQRLQTLHAADGSSINYLQRMERIVPLFLDDLLSVYQKMKSVLAGVSFIYGEGSDPLPDFSDSGYLDELVLWYRRFLRRLEDLERDETWIIQTFSLRKSYENDAKWQEAFKLGSFTFNYRFPDLNHDPKVIEDPHVIRPTPDVDAMLHDGKQRKTVRVASVNVALFKSKTSPGYDAFFDLLLPVTVFSPPQLTKSGDAFWPTSVVSEHFPHTRVKDVFSTRGFPSTTAKGAGGLRNGFGAIPLRNITPYGSWSVKVARPVFVSGSIPDTELPVEYIPDDIVVEIASRYYHNFGDDILNP